MVLWIQKAVFRSGVLRFVFSQSARRFFTLRAASITANAISAKSKAPCRALNSFPLSYRLSIALPFTLTGALERPLVCLARFVFRRFPPPSALFASPVGWRGHIAAQAALSFSWLARGRDRRCFSGWRDSLPAYLISGALSASEKGRWRLLGAKQTGQDLRGFSRLFSPFRGSAFIPSFSFVSSHFHAVRGLCLASRLALEGGPACGGASSASGASAKFITGTLTKRVGVGRLRLGLFRAVSVVF